MSCAASGLGGAALAVGNWLFLGLFVCCLCACGWGLVRVVRKNRAVQRSGQRRSKAGRVSSVAHWLLALAACFPVLRGALQLLFLPGLDGGPTSAFRRFLYAALASAGWSCLLCAVAPLYIFFWLSGSSNSGASPAGRSVRLLWALLSACLLLGWAVLVVLVAALPDAYRQLREALAVYLAVYYLAAAAAVAAAALTLAAVRARPPLLRLSGLLAGALLLVAAALLVDAFAVCADARAVLASEYLLNALLLVVPLLPLAVLHWPKKTAGSPIRPPPSSGTVPAGNDSGTVHAGNDSGQDEHRVDDEEDDVLARLYDLDAL